MSRGAGTGTRTTPQAIIDIGLTVGLRLRERLASKGSEPDDRTASAPYGQGAAR